jgi:ABC-type multidrug transport system ATPase subunit
MPSASPLLSIDDLHFSHPSVPVFSGFGARIGAGLTLVCGDESTGKSTLLRLLAGELTPQHGHLTLHGISAGQAPEAYRAQVFHADPRSDTLDKWTARAWLDAQARHYPGWDAEALALHIQGFALAEHLDKTFYALSTGTRRKVCMAAALASQAPLTLIDEPIAGLDKPSIAYLAQALGRSSQGAERAVVVAHYTPLAGVQWAQVLELPPRQ